MWCPSPPRGWGEPSFGDNPPPETVVPGGGGMDMGGGVNTGKAQCQSTPRRLSARNAIIHACTFIPVPAQIMDTVQPYVIEQMRLHLVLGTSCDTQAGVCLDACPSDRASLFTSAHVCIFPLARVFVCSWVARHCFPTQALCRFCTVGCGQQHAHLPLPRRTKGCPILVGFHGTIFLFSLHFLELLWSGTVCASVSVCACVCVRARRRASAVGFVHPRSSFSGQDFFQLKNVEGNRRRLMGNRWQLERNRRRLAGKRLDIWVASD